MTKDDKRIIKLLRLPTQKAIEECTLEEATYLGAYGCGKTVVATRIVLRECMKFPGNFGCVAANDYPQLEKTTIRKMLAHLGETDIWFTYNENKKLVSFANGSQFHFQGLDIKAGPEGLQGPDYGFVIVDEIQKIAWEWIEKLIPRLRRHGCSNILRMFGNPPPLEHWLEDRYIKERDPHRQLFTATTYEARPVLPEGYIERMERMYPKGSTQRARYLLGKMGVPLEGAVYPEFSEEHLVDELPEFIGHFGAIDFGFRNPFCFLAAGVTKDDGIVVFGEHHEAEMPLDHHVEQIRLTYKGGPIFGDPSGAQEAEELRQRGIHVVPAENSVSLGIDDVRTRLINGGLKILRGTCPNLVRTFGTYLWGKDEKPIKKDDHAQDALRYLVTGWDHVADDNINISADVFASAGVLA